MDMLSEIRQNSHALTLLYVEDHQALREKVFAMLKKLFPHVITAVDGEEGLKLFKMHKPEIVITDINMPNLNGLDMVREIKLLNPETQCIFTSAHDEKEYLLEALSIGIDGFLVKPLKTKEIAEVLLKSIKKVLNRENSSFLDTYSKDIVQHQHTLLAMVEEGKIVFGNKMFLSFFAVKSIEEFNTKYQSFGSLLEVQKGFLYNSNEVEWFEAVRNNPNEIFHVDIVDANKEHRHFILKMNPISDKQNAYVLSLSDVSKLDVVTFFEDKQKLLDPSKKEANTETIYKLLDLSFQEKSKIKIHNFYKGLTVTNNAYIVDMTDTYIEVKTSFAQLKAIKFQGNFLMSSALFPNAIQCENIVDYDFNKSTIKAGKMYFLPRNPTQRKSVRIEPMSDHIVSMDINGNNFHHDISIADLSVDSVKVSLLALPAGLKVDTEVLVHITLDNSSVPIKFKRESKVLRVDEREDRFFVVLLFAHIPLSQKRNLIDYIAKRQMNLIREFKGMGYE